MRMKTMVPGFAFCCGAAFAQAPALPDPAGTDPAALGWMQGFPPAPDKVIKFSDGSNYKFPRTRWSFSHTRELVPTVNVWHGDGRKSALPRRAVDLDALKFIDDQGKEATWAEMLTRTYTDGVLVMHKGEVIYEKYFGAGEPQLPHTAFSVTKSLVGTIAAMLAHEGKLDPDAPVTRYVPELKDSAYGDAMVRQVMDMTTGVRYSETYSDPKAEVWDYARAGGMLATGPNYAGPQTFAISSSR